MLSNKWTFSLTSLILILAFALIASPALAQFDVTLAADPVNDVSHADGFQAERTAADGAVTRPTVTGHTILSANAIRTTIRITTGAVVAG